MPMFAPRHLDTGMQRNAAQRMGAMHNSRWAQCTIAAAHLSTMQCHELLLHNLLLLLLLLLLLHSHALLGRKALLRVQRLPLGRGLPLQSNAAAAPGQAGFFGEVSSLRCPPRSSRSSSSSSSSSSSLPHAARRQALKRRRC